MSLPASNEPPGLDHTSENRNTQNNLRYGPELIPNLFSGRMLRTLKKVFLHFKHDIREDWVGHLNKIEIEKRCFRDMRVPKGFVIKRFKPLAKQAVGLGVYGGERFYMIFGESFDDSGAAPSLICGYFTFLKSGDIAVIQRVHIVKESIRFDDDSDPNNCLHDYVRMCGDWVEIQRWYYIIVITKGLLLD